MEINLFHTDFVIIKPKTSDMVRHKNGQITIYSNEIEAQEDSVEGEEVVRCTELSDINKHILKENIKIFMHG